MIEGRSIDLSGIDPAFHAAIAALACDMQTYGERRGDPVRTVFGLLGDRWSTLILLVLAFGTWRHAELQRVVGRLGAEDHISRRVLTAKLRALEREGMVVRHVESGSVPPKVSYALTALGRDLHDKAATLIAWVNERQEVIRQARAAFDMAGD